MNADAVISLDGPCEREPIHAPGAIQPHMALICLDPASLAVLSVSANVKDVAPGLGDGAGLAPLLSQVLGGNGLDHDYFSMALGPDLVPPPGGHLQAHLSGGVLLCEIEAFGPEDAACPSDADLVNSTLSRMRGAQTLEQLAGLAAEGVRQLSGMERVLVYRFDRDGHGEVIAESRNPDFEESFLGFHFPADDIPPQARALYLKSPMRFAPRRDYTPVELRPAMDPRNGAAYDLGCCLGRVVSPFHRMYQANLGVDGSMSVSVIDDGRLWGLIVGHHRHACRVRIPARAHARTLAEALSMRLHATETAEERDARALHVTLHARLLEQIAGADDFVRPLVDGPIKLTDLFFASSGAAVVYDDGTGYPLDVRVVGDAPPPEAVVRLAAYCHSRLSDGVFACDCISADLPDFAQYSANASGVLGISVGDAAQHMILWFRPEQVLTTVWGGATPDHISRQKDDGNYLPRRSFERWVVERRGHAREWSQWKLDIARSLRTALNDVILRQMRTIRSLNARLEESDKAKSRFLAHMSHELRTPLNAVSGFAEMLRMGVYGPISPRQTECLEHIGQAAGHLLTMINDILDLSKVEAGHVELSEGEILVSEVIGASLDLLGSLLSDAGLYRRITGDGLDLRLFGDRRLVMQMLINLISNSAKYTPSGGSIDIRAARDDQGRLSITVADTGIGIAHDMLAKVLEPFRQADTDVNLARKGTGLGLPIVKALVELHGGQLHLDSTLGAGTVVALVFPAERVMVAGNG